jgi:hypothetical protein
MLMAQWVTDKQYGFKIQIPSNWTQESKVDGSDKVYDFLDPTQNIFIEIRAFKGSGLSADKIAQVFESQYLANANRVAFESYTLNNTPGKFAGYTMNVDGLDVGIGAFYAVKNGNGYVIWSMIETKHYNQYSGQGDAIMNTFTTFASSSTQARAIVIPSSFKITDMKTGRKLTSDYNILAQDETTVFESNQPKIFVIWDWEGSAAGKTITINWYKDGKEISAARKTYTLPNAKQGYGYADIIKPAGGFKAGSYYVQINFENKKQKRINFTVKKAKAASNQSSGFVITPPASGNSGGKGLKPQSNSQSNNTSSFMIDINHVKLGSALKPGSKTELKNSSNKFYKNTSEVIIVFNWTGNGNGKQLKVNWSYYKPGTSNKMDILSDTYQFPNKNGGGSNFVLTKPNNGWPLGQYWVEFYLDGQFQYEWRFDVIEGSASGNSGAQSSTKTNWGKASGGSAAANSHSNSSASGSVKKIVLISDGQHGFYSFKSGKIHNVWDDADIKTEPWCTEDAGVCGNWLATNETDMDAVISPPSSGYISDVAGYEDCQLMPKNKVVVVKLKDGTYAKIKIINVVLKKIQNSQYPCQQTTTMLVQYPF